MTPHPDISIVIPVYNDPEGLRQTLDSLANQQGPPNYEIRVVDNDSTDETPDVIRTFESEYHELVFGHSETDIQSSYAARNTGIEYSMGDIIVFLDADVTVEETFVGNLFQRLEESDVDYLGCNVEMYLPEGEDTLWARYDVAMGLPVEHYLKTKGFAPTCALAVHRNVIEQVGLFDETLVSGGDKEFARRVHNHNFVMEYAPDIVVQHPARTSLDSLVKKASRIGRGQVQLWKHHDLAHHPLSPFRLLPPSPRRIKNRGKSGQSLLTVYFISYFLKFVQTLQAGRLYLQKVFE